jgi:hypothetical protein
VIVPRFGISRRRHLPVFKFLDHSVGPVAALRTTRQFWGWSLARVPDSSLVEVRTPLDRLVMSRDRAGMMLYEWGTWMRCYAPPTVDFRGKTILDVGAGEGETVEFYRLKGAKSFICVEPDPERARRLRENSARNGWEAEVLEEPFSVKILDRPFDFMKMDCEGCERALIGTNITFPSVLETHGSSTTEAFLRAGFAVVRSGENASLVSNVPRS